jgi:hydrogenase/urease accessory protein HupE
MPRPRFLQLTLLAVFAVLLALFAGWPARAHPLPISSVDVYYGADRIEGRVVVHMRDLAPGLGMAGDEATPDPRRFMARSGEIGALLAESLRIGGRTPQWREIHAVPSDPDALELDYVVPGPPPGELAIAAALFPQAPDHQTFVNVYEGGELRQQYLLGQGGDPVTYYAGTASGVLAAAGTFLASGVHHILIGPDHVLFVIGLILLGGPLRRLVLIVTAFTIGHSVTLSLAALDLFVLPAQLIEPAIALSIVVVGVDNLLRHEGARDIRPVLAFAFGLIHGFGFAYVLRDFGLPEAHRAVALVAFNLGVEAGQIAIVLVVGTLMALLRRRSAPLARRVALGGSLAVAMMGAYWFVDRVFFTGSGA